MGEDSLMPEYTVILDSIGGATVLTCEALGIKTIEHAHPEVTSETIKETIMKFKYIDSENDVDWDLVVVDNRPKKERNYNDVKAEESKALAPRRPRNFM